MRLWTIQTAAVWQSLQEQTVFRADPALVEPDFRGAYAWLAGEMRRRLPPPPPGVETPVWAWQQYLDPKRKRPDLRSSGHLPRGERGVRLTLEIDDALVLLSDFELWHFVLNYWYVPASEEDGERFDALLDAAGAGYQQWRVLPPPDLDAAIRDSWQRIFDLTWVEPYVTGDSADRPVQATFWELPLSAVQDVDWFTAR